MKRSDHFVGRLSVSIQFEGSDKVHSLSHDISKGLIIDQWTLQELAKRVIAGLLADKQVQAKIKDSSDAR